MSSPKCFKWHLYNYEENMKPKFQLNQTLFTGVIAEKFENDKYAVAEIWQPESIDGWSYYICDNPLTHGVNLDPVWAQKINVFWLNFTRILRFFWDLALTLLIIPKDAAFAEILVFSNIFGFPTVDWAAIWTKTVNFNYILFEPKVKILKDFSNTVFFLLETTPSQNFRKIK